VLDSLRVAFADYVGCTEVPRERDPVGVTAEEDDPLRAETLGGDHAAKSDGAVSDDRDRLAWSDPRGKGRMVTRAHDVGKA
jgi:hypothetical protein